MATFVAPLWGVRFCEGYVRTYFSFHDVAGAFVRLVIVGGIPSNVCPWLIVGQAVLSSLFEN